MQKAMILFLVFLTGCVSVHREGANTGAGLYAWNNDISAAMVLPNTSSMTLTKKNNQGETISRIKIIDQKPSRSCMQMAMSLNSMHAKANANISDAVLKVSQTVKNETSAKTRQDLLVATTELTKLSKSFQVATERTAFLQIGAFYICQLQANGLSSNDVTELMKILILNSQGLQGSGTKITQPKVTQKELSQNIESMKQLTKKPAKIEHKNKP